MFTIRLGFLFFTVASLVSCSPNTQNKTNLSDHFALKDSHDSVDRNPLNSNMYSTITQKILDGEVSINGHIYQDSAIELEITGFAISINPQKSPFDGYTQGKIPQLKKITIAADNIDISGTLLLPGIDVTLIAKTISFSKDAIINTSALAYPYFLESLTSKELSAVSFAKKGDRGGNISVYASDLKIQDFTKPLLITRGGQGQNAALGIKGADMPPVPSLKKITFQGMSCDVLHETYYTEEPAFDKDCGPRSKKINKTFNVYPKAIGSCRVPTIKVKHERGLKKWPLAPTDSIAGGTPGAGGDSGNIEILVSKNTELSIISALKGSTLLYEQNIGASGAVATPALGGKVSGSGCYVFTDADKVSDFRIYQNGQSLSAPQFTQEQPNKGFTKIETGLFQFPISYLQMKYKYIADLYIERDFKKSFALALELETHLNQISSTNTQTDPKFDLLGLNDLKIQTQGLIIRLASNRDYYGLLQSEIPELGVFLRSKNSMKL